MGASTKVGWCSAGAGTVRLVRNEGLARAVVFPALLSAF